MEDIQQVIWDDFVDKNPFDEEINSSIKAIEEFLKPHRYSTKQYYQVPIPDPWKTNL